MLDTMKTQMRKKLIIDLIILSVIFISCLWLFITIDALELLFEFTRQHDTWELDEFFSAAIVLGGLFSIFSYRRWQDIKKLSLYCEELSMVDPITLLPNRRVIDRLLTKIRNNKNRQNCFPLSLIVIDITGIKLLQSQLGNTVAEQAISELFYRYSLLLKNDQLICYRNTNQCLLYCPELNEDDAAVLSDKVCHMQLETHQSTLNLLSIKSVAVTLTQPEEIDGALERLDDLVNALHFNDNKIVELKLI
ncbi:diguanylate cyclase [Alteromonadaceae bacterium BrNp21-10]|nr:diguanylate cyclase [Alteromonadaceae bacterium BrNp21-10]